MGADEFGLDFRVSACMRPQPSLGLVLPILFVLGTKTANDGIHMHVICFRHQFQDGRLPAILVVKKPNLEHVLNYFSDMHLWMLFKLGTWKMNDGF